ncbi:hypothetical protein PHSY_007067 [Pseudozyma hubeiensis SY62]|uniref:GATA-type domain-containing protein n=1 Tax=Pseudozyma hubeiensis (strain SY62) TaxID=1305764 RepID=R9PDN6_PSEHS|nr:hypothetical protein PHSY_007067 [Pseudozyma hubeiensis SY62]GAC99466.1 hypothetical protein PHSY_007067 [Pseudozyma hubeiensis SY62]
MSIGSRDVSSDSIQVRPGPAGAAADSETVPRTPTPPLPQEQQESSQVSPQQQQILQHQQNKPSIHTQSQQNVTSVSSTSTVAPSEINPVSITAVKQIVPPATVRPPPPASAVSLHAAAAAANKQNAAPATAAPRDASIAAPSGKTSATSSPKKQVKPKVNKASGAAKPKQKRKTNQSGASDELVYRPAPSTAGGTIGAAPDATIPAMLSAAGGGRKALPELVLPFQLPFVDVRPDIPMLDNASLQAAMAMGASETSSLDTGSDSDDYSVQSDDSDLDSEAEESRREARRRRREPATIEESLVLLQSLRQSRLSHLSSLLTPFSQRVRSGMIYPNVLPLSLLHGLNPRDPHVLIQLGRADIHVGPHVFLKTKFWEVRPDYESPPIMNPLGGIHAPASYGPSSVYPRMSVPAPMPQQLPQPQPPKLPSPRAAPTPVVAQPSVPLARPPTTSNKSPIARAATVVAPAGATSTAASASPKTTSLPTPTLPATPMQSSAGVRPAVLPKPAVASSPTIASAPAAKPPLAGAGVGTVPTPASVSATTLPPAPKAVAPAASSTLVSGSTTVTSTTADSKPAAVVTVPASVSQATKPMTAPVSLPRPPMVTPSLPRPPSINHSNIPSSSNPPTISPSNTATSSAAPSKAPSPVGAATAKPMSASANATASPAAAATTTAASAAAPPVTASGSTASNPASAAAKPAAPASANTNAANSQAPARPAGVPPPPAIDAVLVSRVNATAALNPELQELLHIAASGKANPNQLKALGVWIQAITAQLRQDEARNAAATSSSAAGASGSRAPGNTASTTAEGKKSKKNKVDEAAKASKKQAKIEEREAKKKAKAEAKAKAQADKQQTQKQHKQKQQPVHQQHHSYQQQQQQAQAPVSNKLRHPPPGWPTDGPPKPPVIIVEFRENPSMRFILPLWKCLVERTEGIERPSLPKVKKERRSFFDNESDDEESKRIEPELRLSFFAPSLGSDAADGSGLRELEEELKRKAAEEARLNAADTTSTGAQSNVASKSASPEAASAPAASDKTAEDGTSLQGKKKKGGVSGGSKKGGKPIKQEASDATASSDYSHSKKHEVYPLTWSIKGGVTESLWEALGRVPGTMTCQPVKREPEIELEPDVAEFLVPEIRYHLLDLPMEEIKIQKETTDTFVDLYSQMPDRRFILPRVAPALLPQGLEDHLQDRFAVRPQCMQDRPVVKRKAGAREDDVSFSYEGIGLTVIGPNGVKTEPGAAAPPKPPKRKRHVATHNPDGSIKSCGACGKTKTPMWRRGPKGPSQLCNACGARWKAGRLVVPEVAPPPIIEAEEDKSKEDEARKEDEAQASMHGSNALVIPQSSSADDGSYTVMASSGMVGSAPFGDHYSLSPEDKSGMEFGASHLSRGSSSPSPFIRSPIPEDDVMPASVDPSMLSGSNRALSRR